MSVVIPMASAEEVIKASEQFVVSELGRPLETLLRFPRYFLFETINACNARCRACGIDFERKKRATVSPALFEKIAEELSRHASEVEKVMLYLDGEPLMDRQLEQRVRQMKQAGIRCVNLATNASLLTPERGESLMAAGLDEIYITIDSMYPEVFESIRRGLKFATVYQNTLGFIRQRNRLNPKVVIRLQMIQQELNFNEGPAFMEHWYGRLSRGDQIVVVKAHNWASAISVMAFGDEATINQIPCIALWGTFCMHVDGSVPLCCMDSRIQVPLGNLNHHSIEDIWKNPLLAELRRKHLCHEREEIRLCDGCTLWRQCKKDMKRIVGIE